MKLLEFGSKLAHKLRLALFSFQFGKNTAFRILNSGEHRFFHCLQDFIISTDVLVEQSGQLENIAIWCRLLHDRLDLSNGILDFVIHNECLTVVKNLHQANRAVENADLIAGKELSDRLIILGKIEEIIPRGIDGAEELRRIFDGQHLAQ